MGKDAGYVYYEADCAMAFLNPFVPTDVDNPTLAAFQQKPLKVKFIYSDKAANFCKISTVDLSYVATVKSTVEIWQNFVAFSEYMNFNIKTKLDSKKMQNSSITTLL